MIIQDFFVLGHFYVTRYWYCFFDGNNLKQYQDFVISSISQK